MKHFEIIILGAGASGCMCALTACNSGKDILIIDKLAKVGKKLMATGNGRCNLSNTNILPTNKYYNTDIDEYISRFDVTATLELFQNLGLCTQKDEEGRIYPITNSAKSVIDVINNELSKYKNITLSLENKVIKVEKQEENFIVITKNGDFSCKKIVVAMGGKSGEEILNKFKIKYKPFVPSLVALKTESTRLLEGVKISNVELEAFCGNRKYCEIGEILFKDSGISGIVTFNISTLFARENNFSGEIKIDLMPEIKKDELVEVLMDRKKLSVKIKNFFDGMFVSQIGYHILNKVEINNEERLYSTLTENEIEKLAFAIKNINLKVKGNYDNNQVYSGGVKLDELTENLECKNIKNLYFCGEICDVDGICGGYNLQWAWTSGHIVGENL